MKTNIPIISMLFAMMFLTEAALAQDDDPDSMEEQGPLTNDPTKQPLVRVIANPEKFHNEIITVTGYYMFGTHTNHLYLDMEACLHFESVNSIFINGRLNDKDFIPCGRETIKGKLNYSPENRNWRNDSDLRLEDVVFTDHIEY